MNLPEPFIRQMQELLTAEAAAFFDALQAEQPTSIRYNPLKNSPLNNIAACKQSELTSVGWSQHGYYLSKRPTFTLDPLLHAGAYYVQEAASMFIEQAIAQHQPEREGLNILDLCAAPGGKSTHLLSLFSSSSLLVSNEVVRSRASILRENIHKWGYPNAVVTSSPTKDFLRLANFFDIVLVDAPCSGEGMFRKDKNAIAEWSESNVALCAERQRKILADVWPSLKDGGLLIYSTCTYNRKENEENVLWLIDQLGAESLQLQLKSVWGVSESVEKNCYAYRFYPHKTKSEGFFMAALRKLGSSKNTHRHKKKTPEGVVKNAAPYQELLQSSSNKHFIRCGNEVKALIAEKYGDIMEVEQHLHVTSSGLTLGELKGKDFIPSAALALSTDLNTAHFPSLNLDLATALRYLRRDAIDIGDFSKGIVLACYENVPLGWLKNIGNRCNNLYPSEWRIRMNVD